MHSAMLYKSDSWYSSTSEGDDRVHSKETGAGSGVPLDLSHQDDVSRSPLGSPQRYQSYYRSLSGSPTHQSPTAHYSYQPDSPTLPATCSPDIPQPRGGVTSLWRARSSSSSSSPPHVTSTALHPQVHQQHRGHISDVEILSVELHHNHDHQQDHDPTATSAAPTRQHRKQVGMRYLFPPLPDSMSLLEKTRIWVERHTHGYFMNWTEQQLAGVDPLVRPVHPISETVYKHHMNRSEHCRNTKLKYCLESEEQWANEYRAKLARPSSQGGFTGLCQAKIAAATLWREHSEHYKSHQARYPQQKRKHAPMATSPVDAVPVQAVPVPVPVASHMCPSTAATSESPSYRPLLVRSPPAVHDIRPVEPLAVQLSYQRPHLCAAPDDCHVEGACINDSFLNYFPSLRNSKYRLRDRIDIAIERHTHNYFVDWTQNKLKHISDYMRPHIPITREAWKTEIQEGILRYDVSLSFIMNCNEEWAAAYKRQVDSMEDTGHFRSLCDAKKQAYQLCVKYAHEELNKTIDQLTAHTLPDGDYTATYSDVPCKKLKSTTITSSDAISHKEVNGFRYPSTMTSMGEPRAAYESELRDECYRALYFSLGYIFNPMPSTVSVYEQVEIWLERYRSNFYLNYDEHQLSRIEELCRPKVIVTREVYVENVPSIIKRILSKLEDIFASARDYTCAETFVANIRTGHFLDIIDVFARAEDIWYSLLNAQNSEMTVDSSKIDLPPREHAPEMVDMTKERAATPQPSPQAKSLPPTSPQRKNSKRSGSLYSESCTSDYSSSSQPSPQQAVGSGDALDLRSRDDEPLSGATYTGSPLIQKLWSMRTLLHDSLQLNASESWHDKLEKHIPLLRKHLGDSYKLPATVAECMADMTLITLHAEIEHL